MLWAFCASAHEMTPAYPKFKPSHVYGVYRVDLSLFNSREEIAYYEVELFDVNWGTLPFSTLYRIFKVDYKERVSFSVYVREADIQKASYVCTTSKVKKTYESSTVISSRICSRLEGDPL